VNHWLLTLRVRFGPPLGESSSMYSSGIKDMTKPQDRAVRWAPRAALREQFDPQVVADRCLEPLLFGGAGQDRSFAMNGL
jgi:hypothetical protein